MLSEQLVGMARNGWTASIGIDGRYGSDYAARGVSHPQELVVDVTERRLVCVKPWSRFAVSLRMDGLTERNGYFYVEGENLNSEA